MGKLKKTAEGINELLQWLAGAFLAVHTLSEKVPQGLKERVIKAPGLGNVEDEAAWMEAKSELSSWEVERLRPLTSKLKDFQMQQIANSMLKVRPEKRSAILRQWMSLISFHDVEWVIKMLIEEGTITREPAPAKKAWKWVKDNGPSAAINGARGTVSTFTGIRQAARNFRANARRTP